jgi:hypothetical protein
VRTHEASDDGAGRQGLPLQTAQRAISTPHVRADATGKAAAGEVVQDGFAIDQAAAYVGRMVPNNLEITAATGWPRCEMPSAFSFNVELAFPDLSAALKPWLYQNSGNPTGHGTCR